MHVARTEMRKAPFTSGSSVYLAKMILVPFVSLMLAFLTLSPALVAKSTKDQFVSPGFVKEFEASPEDAMQALHDVLEDQTIHGTYIFDKQTTLTGAVVAESTPLFEPWKGPGKVFYKIRKDAIAPRHFLESADQGTIAVRFVLTILNFGRVRLRIDAVYVETARKTLHPSDLTVEASEYKVFQDDLQALQFAEQEAADAKRRRDSAELVKQTQIHQREDETTRLAEAQSSTKDLQQKVSELRHEVERRVKSPGADLKSAPFRAAANVKTLAAYTEVVIVIVTPHWFGVETPDGQRGWLPTEELENLP
jgi:hypothetical protein